MRRRKLLGFSLLFAFVVGLTVYKLQVENTNISKIRFVIPPYQDSLVVLLGQKKGWFKEEGLDVDFTIVGLDEVQEALASGSVDVGWSTTTNTMIASVKSSNVAFLYPWNVFDNGFALIARPGGPIKPLTTFEAIASSRDNAVTAAAAQLKGMTVVTTSNTDMEQAVASLAERGSLIFANDIKIINLPPDEGLAAFLAGTGDAYMGGIPQRTRAVKEGMIEVIKGLDLGPAPINGLVANKSYLSAHEGEILKIIKVWFRIVEYTNSHVDEVGDFVSAELNKRTGANYSKSDFRLAWNGLEHFIESPEMAKSQVLESDGPNYWRSRWDEDNKYFYSIIKSTPHVVSPDGIFLGEYYQEKLTVKTNSQ